MIIVHHDHHHHRPAILVQTFCSIAGISDNDFADGNSKVADKGKGAGKGKGKVAVSTREAHEIKSCDTGTLRYRADIFGAPLDNLIRSGGWPDLSEYTDSD